MDMDTMPRIPIRDWLDPEASFVATHSVCRLRRALSNSVMASARFHRAHMRILVSMVNDWTPATGTFMRLPNYVQQFMSEEDVHVPEFCNNKFGPVYSYIGLSGDAVMTKLQILEERIHLQGTFPNVLPRELFNLKWYTKCNMLVVDPSNEKVPFHTHIPGTKSCRLEIMKF